MSKNMFSDTKRSKFEQKKEDVIQDIISEEDNPFLKKIELKKDKLSISLDPNINNFLGVMSKETGMSKSEIINIILEENLKENKNIKELASMNESIANALNDI